MQQRFKREVRQRFRRAVDEYALVACPGHKRRALGDGVHALLELYGIGDLVGADHVEHRGVRLHDVRRHAARVRDGIVDAAVVGHVLAQKLHADVHKLHSVERAAPVVRVSGGVRGNAVEFVEHLNAGVVRAGGYLVRVGRVPGERGVEPVPEPFTRHIRLGRAALLAGAAEEKDGTGLSARGEIFLYRRSRGERTGTEQIVAAAVAVPAGGDALRFGNAALLRKTGERVKLAEDADHRMAGAVGAGKRRFNAAEVLLHREAQLFQRVRIERCGFEFLERKLRLVPDRVGDRGVNICMRVDRVQRGFFDFVHITTPWKENPANVRFAGAGRCLPACPAPRCAPRP